MIGATFSSNISRGINSLNSSMMDLGKTFTKLTSGMRINKAADDAAGLAVATSIQVSALMDSQAMRNVGDAQSALSIADGAVGQIQDLNARRAELAMQASNGTYSDEQRATMQAEFSQLGSEIQRLTESTEFNGTKLLNGEAVSVQVGSDGSPGSSLSVGGLAIGDALAAGGSLDISTQAGAQAALGAVQTFTETVNTQRTDSIGAAQSRLSSIQTNLATSREAKLGAASRITDADIASEAANVVMQSIRTQASAAVIAQANRADALNMKTLLG
jgi:flagellin